MAIQFPTNIPNPSELTFTLRSNVQRSKSTFTKSRQIAELLGSHWIFSATWGVVTPEMIAPLRAFLVSLRGGVMPFQYSDISAPRPNGLIGTPASIVGFAGLNTLEIATAQPETKVFNAGDYIQIEVDGGEGYEYKMIIDDVTTDISGNAFVAIEPHFRHDPIIGSTVIHDNPVGVFVHDENDHAWNVSAPMVGDGFTISGSELVV